MNVGSEGGGKGKAEIDFDLNLAPIIDCFTVLITFMLVSASFIQISILEASVAAQETSAPPELMPSDPVAMASVEVKATGDLEVKVRGTETTVVPIPKSPDGSHFRALVTELENVKQKFPTIASLTVSAENAVEYKDLVKVMELSRQPFPSIVLGGF